MCKLVLFNLVCDLLFSWYNHGLGTVQHSHMAPQQEPEPVSLPPSKRWTQFYAALQLAIQRAAHKWTSVFALFLTLAIFTNISLILSFKDFSECFPLWCEEQPNGAEGIFNTVSSFIETHIVVRFSHFSLPFSQPSIHTR